ncbi:hypothetical protein LOC54_01375 [Acetobacter sp. AN02]|uniref:septal ring lytic transglycosylase RlpA family protein n=1 Tax=Acetobacter sp. AN02 TaxID=2894186 RepID=UPI0024343612|nr:RlpA-like double-psi beta-barrel domain-containing protein [Acetobacter sp. AN02]MDG6093774.1 hypothetical protein [Acetobacter sp. AN02]
MIPRIRARYAGLAGLLAMTACHHRAEQLPDATPHYVVGAAWQAGGVWTYPHEDFAWQGTGIAVTDSGRSGARRTVDGEPYNADSMTGAHPWLQLPAIVQVRNLDNGRVVRIRLNDRGPDQRGRILSVTPRVASLLGMGAAPARVEITEDVQVSRTLAETLPGGPLLPLTAAPVEAVQAVSLDAPSATLTATVTHAAPESPATLPDLPATWSQGYATGGLLWIELGRFTGRQYADMMARQAGGTVTEAGTQGTGRWIAQTGPFNSIAEADAALDLALREGVTGARIVVR